MPRIVVVPPPSAVIRNAVYDRTAERLHFEAAPNELHEVRVAYPSRQMTLLARFLQRCSDAQAGGFETELIKVVASQGLPDGRVDRVVALPVSFPSMGAFGGDNLDILYVTSVREVLSARDLAREPLAGGLFAIDVRVAGLPEPRYKG